MWFNRILSESIRSFQDFEESFNYHFITTNKVPKDENALSSFKKWPDESLRDYND